MSEFENQPRELAWDDEIQNEGSPYEILPEGDYDFRVDKFERARHNGSDKIPSCNKAILTLSVFSEAATGTVLTNLFLYSKVEWKLCQFFTSIGHRKHGEALRMNWAAVPGSSGRCHVGIRTWVGNDGKEHQGNEITEFYDPAEEPKQPAGGNSTSSAAPGSYTPGKF